MNINQLKEMENNILTIQERTQGMIFPFSTSGKFGYRLQVEQKRYWLTKKDYLLVTKQYENLTEDVYEIDKGDLRLYLSDLLPNIPDSEVDDMYDVLETSEETLALMLENGYCTGMEVCDEN